MIFMLRNASSRQVIFFIRRILICAVLGICALLCVASGVRANGDPTDDFLRDFENQRGKVTSYSARFVQKKTLALFDESKISSGSVLYKAPRQMLWKYEAPDKTQMRIDEESVAFFFPDLEQIEIYALEQSQGASYFFFAFEASADELKEKFDITVDTAAADTANRVRLVPKGVPLTSQLNDLTLWLRETDFLPQKILINELSGDSTEIELSGINANEPIDDDELKFNAPEGTEIIRAGSDMF